MTNARKRTAIESVKKALLRHSRHPRPVAEELYSMPAVAVPFGNCTEPTNVKAEGKACPARFQCGRLHVLQIGSFPPSDLKAHLDRIKEDLAWQPGR